MSIRASFAGMKDPEDDYGFQLLKQDVERIKMALLMGSRLGAGGTLVGGTLENALGDLPPGFITGLIGAGGGTPSIATALAVGALPLPLFPVPANLVTIYTSTGIGIHTCGINTRIVLMWMCGAGGGGGGRREPTDFIWIGGGGGGAGATCQSWAAVTANQSLTFAVGIGGTAGTDGGFGTPGTDGTSTTVTINSTTIGAGGGTCGQSTNGGEGTGGQPIGDLALSPFFIGMSGQGGGRGALGETYGPGINNAVGGAGGTGHTCNGYGVFTNNGRGGAGSGQLSSAEDGSHGFLVISEYSG